MLLTAAACALHWCFVAADANCRFGTFATALSHKVNVSLWEIRLRARDGL